MRLLRSAGMQVHAYSSAARFLDEVDHAEPGCILLDISTSGLGSAEGLTQLKGRHGSLPVIVVSARDTDTVHKLANELDAKMFLRKPVDDQALLDAINWVTKSRFDQ
jgi:FixJ family two-component response regulator